MTSAEIPLAGGNVNDAVVRVGETVHRAASPQSATIQRLLHHLRERGVEWVPEPLGFDDEGREVLGFIAGEVAHGEPDFRSNTLLLTDVARALRQWHDATVSFPREPGDVWIAHDAVANPEVVAHNDFAPYNHVFRAGRFVGAIDFDVCYPASREWDLAWTLYRYVYLPEFAPLAPAAGGSSPGEWPDLTDLQAATIEANCAPAAATFMGAYGSAPAGVLGAMPARLRSMAAWCAGQDSAAHRAWGHMYAAHARWIEALPGN
ncbi:phosphotransferase [Demequina aurantiaca]|uniref:phosphotransferase n=1 Tax=Demequina aurantiaca TaxID=676200 RepID=UPI003D351D7F